MANFVICGDHYAMTISQWTSRKERSLSVYYIKYFVVIVKKLTLPLYQHYIYPLMVRLRREPVDLSPKWFFGRIHNHLLHVSFKELAMFSPWRSKKSLPNARIPLMATHSLFDILSDSFAILLLV